MRRDQGKGDGDTVVSSNDNGKIGYSHRKKLQLNSYLI